MEKTKKKKAELPADLLGPIGPKYAKWAPGPEIVLGETEEEAKEVEDMLRALQQEIAYLNRRRTSVDHDKLPVVAARARRVFPKLYAIYATPSNLDYHVCHTVARFSTLDKAEARLVPGSQDVDGGVTWTYDIRPVSSEDVSDIGMRDLNTVPSHYPYTGR